MTSKKPPTTIDNLTFAELSSQLEDILLKLQAEDLDVDHALELHEQGTVLIKQLEQRLSSAENVIHTLKTKNQ
jgi:exodeoxyribonuclease VII small subunit